MGASFQFSAQPQVIRTGQQMYRDPYKDFIKIAPQNIMHDRRVVRGNTFAALVIPTSMQPDPVLAEKQKEQEIERRYRMERLRKKRQEENIKTKMMEDEEEKIRIKELEHQNDWKELEDYDNMIEEQDIEPDYYIDKPPTPVFIENPKGTDRSVQVIDEELFDFELEVEPILQVLVGKACENAMAEVIEEWEKDTYTDHKKKFLIIKEAELMETQRMEAARNRRRREAERRYANFRTAKGQLGWANSKLCARQMSKKLLSLFKRDTYQELKDQGILRDPTQFAMCSRFLPSMYGQARAELLRDNEFTEGVDSYIMMTLRANAREHKQSIQKEFKRREEKKRKEFKIQKEKEEQRRKRREERAAARERARVQELRKKVINTLIEPSKIEEKFDPEKIKIYDVRDPDGTEEGIFLIGGFMGEIMTTFTWLYDYILANPQNQNFHFSYDAISEYLKSLLIGSNFPDGAITLHVSEKEEGEEGMLAEDMDDERFLRHCLTKPWINDYGLSFFFEVWKDMVISKEFIEWLYRAIVKIIRTKPEEIIEPPIIPEANEDGTPLSEEDKQNLQKQIEEIKVQNENILKKNEDLNRFKAKIRVEYRNHNFADNNECALIKLLNFREPPKAAIPPPLGNESNKKITDKSLEISKDEIDLDDSRRESIKSGERDEGTFEDVPPKIILCHPYFADGSRVIIVHSEAQIGLRKMLIENAKKHFKELEKLDLNSVFSHPKNKSELLEEKFIEHVKKNLQFDKTKPVPVFDFQNNVPVSQEEQQPTPQPQ